MFLAVKTLCLLLIVSAFIICPCYKKRKRTQEQRRIAPPLYDPPQQAHPLYEPPQQAHPLYKPQGQARPVTLWPTNPSVAVPEPEWSEQSEPSTARPIAAEEAATATSGSSSSSVSISTAKQIGENDQNAPGDPTKQQSATEEGTIDSKVGGGDYETCCAIL